MKYENFVKSLKNLETVLNMNPPYTPVEQMGIIGLFNISFELSWKLMKEILEFHSIIPDKIASPRTIIKLAYEAGMIKDEERWLEILNTRNLLAHIYSENDSIKTVELIKNIYCQEFLKLKNEIDENWGI